MDLITPIAPPVPTPAVVPPTNTPPVDNTAAEKAAAEKAVADKAAADKTAADKTAAEKLAAEKNQPSAAKSLAEKIENALKGKTVPTAEEKAAEEKAAADKVAADKAEAEKAAKAGTKVEIKEQTDAEIEAEVAAKTKGMDGAHREAFKDKSYKVRELQRQLKAAVPKTEVDALQTKITEMQVQLDAAKTATPADPVEVEALKKQVADYEQEFSVIKVEKTKPFQDAVTKPREAIEEQARKFAKKYELDADKIVAALKDTSDKQSDLLIDALEGMNEIDKRKMIVAADKMVEISEKETTLRANAKEALAKIGEKAAGQTEAEKAAAKQARETAHVSNWSALKEALPDVLKTFEGDDDATKTWNATVTGAETFSKDADFESMKPEVQSQVLQRAAVYPLIVGMMKSVEAQLAASKTAHEADLAELTKFRSKVPGGEGTPKDGNPTKVDVREGETGGQRVARLVAEKSRAVVA